MEKNIEAYPESEPILEHVGVINEGINLTGEET